MLRPFQALDQFFDVVIAGTRRQSEPAWMHRERFAAQGNSRQPKPQKAIHRLFQRTAGLTHLFFQKTGHIIVNRERSSHISMLLNVAS